MMQAERDESAVETVRLKRQGIGGPGTLAIPRNRITVLVTYIEHRQCLIDTDNATGLYVLRNRPRHAPCAGSHVEHPFVTAKRQHLDHFGCQRAADTLHRRTPVKVRRVRRIVEAGLMVVPVAVLVLGGMT